MNLWSLFFHLFFPSINYDALHLIKHSGTFDWKLYCSKNDTWNWKGIMILCINNTNILEIFVLFYCRVFCFYLWKSWIIQFTESKSSTCCNCLYKLYTNHDLWFIKNSPFSDFQIGRSFFRLFPIISISQKIFSIFFLTLEKIGIDEKVICYHNISN